MVRQGGVPKIIGQKKFIFGKKRTISFKGRSFVIFSDEPAFRIGLKQYFLFDYNGTGQMILDDILEKNDIVQGEDNEYVLRKTGQLFFRDGSENQLQTVELMDEICNNEVIYQALRASEPKKSWTDMIIWLVAGLGIGLFIGLIVGLSGILSEVAIA